MFERIKRFFGFERVLVVRDERNGARIALTQPELFRPMVEAGFGREVEVLLSTSIELVEEQDRTAALEKENNQLTFELNACLDLLGAYKGNTLRQKIETLIIANEVLSGFGDTQTVYLSKGGEA